MIITIILAVSAAAITAFVVNFILNKGLMDERDNLEVENSLLQEENISLENQLREWKDNFKQVDNLIKAMDHNPDAGDIWKQLKEFVHDVVVMNVNGL